MTLQQMRYVIAIAETGSLSRASEFLYVSQPSLSSVVRELEEELGFVIFYRSGKGMTLTDDRVEFISLARQVHSKRSLEESNDSSEPGGKAALLENRVYRFSSAFTI